MVAKQVFVPFALAALTGAPALALVGVLGPAFGYSASAQDLTALERQVGLERIEQVEPSVAVVFEGLVNGPDGAPAEGAVVVSSAGGQAVTDGNGSYRLETRVPIDAESVQLTAVGRAGRNLLASVSVALPLAPGLVHVNAVLLAQGSACQPSWLPTFGEQPGTSNLINVLAVFDDANGPALYAGGDFATAGGVTPHRTAPLGSGRPMWNTLFHHPLPSLQWGVVLAAALIAAWTDLRDRRIPNLLTGPVLVGGLGVAAGLGGWAALADALLASVIAALPFLFLFAFAAGGAGDAKLMAALGAWLGSVWGGVALVLVCLSGVLLGVLQAAHAGRLKAVLANVSGTARGLARSSALGERSARLDTLRASLPPTEGALTMPYGLAIASGMLLTAGGAWVWNAV